MTIRVMIDGEMVVAPHKPLRKVLAKSNMIRFGIPKEHWERTFEDFNTYGEKDLEDAKAFFIEYCENMYENFDERRGIYLWGSNGTGKTMLCSLLVKDAYRRQFSTALITFPEYIEHYTEAWSCRDFDTQQELKYNFKHRWKGVDILVLDEIGKEYVTKISPVILEDCLRYRAMKSLVTILITNLNPTDFNYRYGESISSLAVHKRIELHFSTSDRRKMGD